MSRRSRRGHRSRDGGYTAIEAAITMPALILITMLVVQYALLWHGRHVAESAALSGVEAGRGFEAAPAAGGQAARSYLHDVAPTLLQSPEVSVTRTATTVRVTVRARVLHIIPGGDFTVTESAEGPVERFVSLIGGFGTTEGPRTRNRRGDPA